MGEENVLWDMRQKNKNRITIPSPFQLAVCVRFDSELSFLSPTTGSHMWEG